MIQYGRAVMVFKNSPDRCGIYRIISPSGKFYIGSTFNFKKRFWEHTNLLKIGKYPNIALSRAWLKYNGNLKIEPLLICSRDHLLLYEQLLIDNLHPEYNMTLFAGSPNKGKKASKETRLKQSLAQKGRVRTIEHKQNISKSKIGKPLSQAHKDSIRKTLKEKYSNPEDHDVAQRGPFGRFIAWA